MTTGRPVVYVPTERCHR